MNAYTVQFPCKVNDTVYIIDERRGHKTSILKQTVKAITYTNVDGDNIHSSFYVETRGTPYGFILPPNDFEENGIVFDTQEAAETALQTKERKSL